MTLIFHSTIIQDGKAAGQSVPHVHVHILPRMENDFENNDDVYVALDNQRLDREIDFTGPRALRTMAEMAEEARELRQLFDENYRPKDDGAESSPGGGV
jgi:diadenosine tetraphosphate (Ap4A) HIT family hydrolase